MYSCSDEEEKIKEEKNGEMISGLNSGYRELCADGSCVRGGGNEGEGTVLVPWGPASSMYWIPTQTLHFVPTKILRCSMCPFYTRKETPLSTHS